MEFNQLESFLKVVKYKSFSRAAEELYLTQPTISNNIQNLERELQTTLLDRKSKIITLTESGEKLYKYAIELINLRDQALFNIMEHSDKIEGTIELNASSIPEQYILPYIIRDFLEKHPKVSFAINHKNSKDIIDDILEGRENFGIVGAKYSSRNLEYINFYEDELILAVPNNSRYPFHIDEPVDMNLLLEEPFLFRKEGSGTRLFIEQCLLSQDISLKDLNIISLIDSNEMIKQMIGLEIGISFISRLSIENEVNLGLIKPLKIKNLDLRRHFYFVHSSNRTLSPIVQVFRDFLINWKNT